MTDFWLALRGAVLSAFMPKWAQSRDRLKTGIAELAMLRGVPDWFARFEPAVIDSGAQRLHVDRIRARDPVAAMIFMPGTNAYTLLYGEYLTALADQGIEIFAFEPRGHGRSSGGRGSYTIPELVDDYRAVIDYVREQWSGPLFAGGSSQGGIVSLYAGMADGQLDGLICHNLADLSDPDAVQLTRLGKLGEWLKPLMRVIAKLAPELPIPMQVYLDLTREPVRGKRHALQVLYEDPLVPWYIRARTLVSLGETPPPQSLESFQTPVMLLQAANDTIFCAPYMRKLAARMPNASVVEFPGTAHYLIVDNVDIVVPAVRAWVDTRLAAVTGQDR